MKIWDPDITKSLTFLLKITVSGCFKIFLLFSHYYSYFFSHLSKSRSFSFQSSEFCFTFFAWLGSRTVGEVVQKCFGICGWAPSRFQQQLNYPHAGVRQCVGSLWVYYNDEEKLRVYNQKPRCLRSCSAHNRIILPPLPTGLHLTRVL